MECKKTQYASEEFALDHIKRIIKKSTRDKVPTRAYLCNICNLWHLTSSKDWKEEVRLKDLKISFLDGDVRVLRDEIKILKAEIEKIKKANNKEDRVAVKADARVQEANNRVKKVTENFKKLRKDQNDLICKNIQLQKKIDEYEIRKSNDNGS